MLDKINQAVSFLNEAGIRDPEIGIVLGTGLGKMVNSIDISCSIDYGNIPHFPLSTVESHTGKLIFGTFQGRKLLAMHGRFHYYEGYTLQQVTFPVRVMKKLGVRCLLLSNAAGAMNPGFKKGSLMLIDDHINLLPDNPLRGSHQEEFGTRFPDMSRPYSPKINDHLVRIARRENIVLHQGIYLAIMGPNLETRAEYRMFRNFADAVGMSTVPEVIVANQIGLPCSAISVLTDECDPDNLVPATLQDILKTATKAETQLVRIFSALIRELSIDPVTGEII